MSEVLKQRVLGSIEVLPSGCWRWAKSLNRGGYGQIAIGSRTDATRTMALAHRVSYTAFRGPIPEGLDLDHQCHKASCKLASRCEHRACVNPEHLEPSTRRANVQRGYHPQLDKVACSNEHPYVEGSFRVNSKGARVCRRCMADAQARRRKKKAR